MNLSDIVQECRCFDLLDFAGGQTQLDSYCSRELADAKRMAGSIRIACLDSLHHNLQEFLAAVLKTVVESINMTDRTNRHDNREKTERTKPQPDIKARV
jgi:hypothetical protein